MHDISSFFKSINFLPEKDTFTDLEIKKVVLNKKEEVFNIYLHGKKVIPKKDIDLLLEACKNKINGIYPCIITLEYDELTEEDCLSYVEEIIKKLVAKKPSLISLEECMPKIDDDIIIFDVMSPIEEENIKREENTIKKELSLYGFKDYFVTTRLNEELRNQVKELH